MKDRYARPGLVPPRQAKGSVDLWCSYKDRPPSSLSLVFQSEVSVIIERCERLNAQL